MLVSEMKLNRNYIHGQIVRVIIIIKKIVKGNKYDSER